MTKATLNLKGSYNTTIAYPETTDVTANFGFEAFLSENMTSQEYLVVTRHTMFFSHSYTWAEPACTAPYAPCAPHGLAWTCNDQVSHHGDATMH